MARSVTTKKLKQYALGFDIGGGKILAELYEIQGNGALASKPFWSKKVKTEKEMESHTRQVSELLNEAVNQLPPSTTIATIGIASPGRFTPEGTIRPGTSPNMGITSHEFDNVNLYERYHAALPEALKSVPLTVMNDGNAMLSGFIEHIESIPALQSTLKDQHGNEISKHSLRNQHIALLGLGSGVGHAIVKMGATKQYDFVTDGHASKLRVPIDPDDWKVIEYIQKLTSRSTTQTPAFLTFPDQTVRAEDLFKISAICNFCGVDTRRQLDKKIPSIVKGIEFAGKYMARTIALIRSGNHQDVEPANGWSSADKAEAAKTSIYLIGGGLEACDVLINAAAKELEKLNIHNIRLVQMPNENLAARSAAAMAMPVLARTHKPSPPPFS